MLIFVKIATYAVMLGICVFFFRFLRGLFDKSKEVSAKAQKSIDSGFKKSGKAQKIEKKLSSLGVMYRVGNYHLDPAWYLMVRLSIGAVFVLILFLLEIPPIFCLLGLPLGYYGLEFLFIRMNKSDNKDMLIDIYNTYASISIQMKSGLYITSALEYAYKVSKNERYKEAVSELLINMSDRTMTTSESVEIFKNRFKNPEIDKMCAMIDNIARYGVSESYAADLLSEIRGIIGASTLEAEHDIEMKVNITRFAFFTVTIALVAYSVITGFGGMDLFW